MNRCRAECSPNTSLSMLTFVEAKYHAIYDLHLLLSLVDNFRVRRMMLYTLHLEAKPKLFRTKVCE